MEGEEVAVAVAVVVLKQQKRRSIAEVDDHTIIPFSKFCTLDSNGFTVDVILGLGLWTSPLYSPRTF